MSPFRLGYLWFDGTIIGDAFERISNFPWNFLPCLFLAHLSSLNEHCMDWQYFFHCFYDTGTIYSGYPTHEVQRPFWSSKGQMSNGINHFVCHNLQYSSIYWVQMERYQNSVCLWPWGHRKTRISAKGSFKNYVYKVLAFFDHLPTVLI